jgi:hypothetical protein
MPSGTWDWANEKLLQPRILMDEDRVGLQIAAIVGAALGVVTGILLEQGLFVHTLIWALIGAIVVSGAVYCYRAFR